MDGKPVTCDTSLGYGVNTNTGQGWDRYAKDPAILHTVVLGGGLSGLEAACSMLDSGYSVTLVEKRPFLGGRAFSFFDPEADSQVDNGQHIFMGCCDRFMGFLKKLGTFEKIHLQPVLNVPILGRGGRLGCLTSSPLPAPFHILPSFLRYPHLGVKDKLFALYGLVKLMLVDRRQSQLEDQSFYCWLKDHHQTERTIETFWNLITLPTLNDNVRDVSASMGMMVFQEGILKGRGSANIGYAKVGLSELIGEAARFYIQENGGNLLLGRSVSRIVCSESQVTGVELVGGEVVRGDVYISALPYNVVVETLPKEVLACEPLRGISELSSSPIVNVHIWYDRQIMDEEFVAVLDSPLQWVFNKSRILGLSDRVPGQYLCISISGAWDYIHQPKEELQRLFVAAMAKVFPKAAQARAEKVLVVKEERATFRCLPGAATHRPSDIRPLDNLYLAGEWTDTGWPSTMEGAVRSGQRAAELIIESK